MSARSAMNLPWDTELEPWLEPGHTYASVTDKISSVVLTRPLGIGWLAGFALTFSVVMVLFVAIGLADHQGRGDLGHQHSDRLGLRDRELRVVDWYRPRGHADFGDFVFVEPEVADLDQPVRRGNDAVRGGLRRDCSR